MSLSAMRGCVSDAVTLVPPEGVTGSVELVSCCSDAVVSREFVVKEVSGVETGGKNITITREKNF